MLHKSVNNKRDESYGNIRDVGTKSLQINGDKSNIDLKTDREEEENINNRYSNYLEEDDLTLLIHCADNEIKQNSEKGKKKDLTPNLDNSKRVNINQEAYIV